MLEDPPPPENPLTEVAAAFDGRRLTYIGLGLVFLSFFLTWWDVTKYRVSELRGVNLNDPTQTHEVERKKDRESQAEYQQRLDEYRARRALYENEWLQNTRQYGDFYADHFDTDEANYQKLIQFDDGRTHKKGSLVMRGYSTWTGWFGLLFGLMLLASQAAPKFEPKLEVWAWGFPLAGAMLFALFTIMAVAFYFTMPDENGEGYAQGIGLGNYVAILGGIATTAGCAMLGKGTMERRLADIQAGRVETPADDVEEDDVDETPAQPPKNRLQDW